MQEGMHAEYIQGHLLEVVCLVIKKEMRGYYCW